MSDLEIPQSWKDAGDETGISLDVIGRRTRLPVTEAERTPEGARDRFHRVTQGALERFREAVIVTKTPPDVASRRLANDCKAAIAEYHRNLGIATGVTDVDPTDLTCEDP